MESLKGVFLSQFRSVRGFGVLLTAVGALISGVCEAGTADASSCIVLPKALTVGQAWGGTRVGYAAIEARDAIYIAYYDKERWVTVGEVNKCTGKIRSVRIPSRFNGWDAHNYLTLSLDRAERLHIAGNMHVSPLVYARMSRAGDLASLAELRPQIGSFEERTTYPVFFNLPDGSLGFGYRDGESGDGFEVINRFDGLRWSRWLSEPLFAAGYGSRKISAYHTDYVKGEDGYFHVAWVWRGNATVESNFNVNYARSPDLKAWYTSGGKMLRLPITPDNAEVVDVVPPNSGLFNNIKIGFDGVGRPIISYLKFDGEGDSQLWHARFSNDRWERYQSTRWRYRWNPKGRGTIPALINFDGVVFHNGLLLERVRHPEVGSVTLRYDDFFLEAQLRGDVLNSAVPKVVRDVGTGTVLNVAPVRAGDNPMLAVRSISWLSMPADTRDRPRRCNRDVGDCIYVYDLILHSPS